MADEHIPERREAGDRRSHVGVTLDGFANGAGQNVRTVIALLKVAVGAFTFTITATVAVAIWVFTVGATNDRQDAEIAATAIATQSISETMQAVAAEVIALRRDVEHLREGEQ